MTVWRRAMWHRVVALAPLLLVLGALPSQVLLRCRMDGQLREACCCPGEKTVAPVDHPTVASRCCCDREVSAREVVQSQAASQSDLAPRAALAVTILPELVTPEPLSPSPQAKSGHPPREGPPLLLLKQAFLI